MSTHKHFDKICCVFLALSLVLTVLFMNAESLGVQAADKVMGYENRLFDKSRVHTIDIVMNDWDEFLETCTNEQYATCSVVIDGEAYKNVAIRAKGNTSLSSVKSYGNDRYSFKIEFDHYDNAMTYHGLDKLSLNNVIQDNSYMKDFLAYTMMNDFGVASSLCSYVYITVNGEDWGLYLAVEGVEDAFLQRNYGNSYGELYKPDSMSMGGGVGNGKDFDMNELFSSESSSTDSDNSKRSSVISDSSRPSSTEGGSSNWGGFDRSEKGSFDPSQMGGGNFDFSQMGGNMFGGRFGMGSSDVKLQYTDDNYSSYSNIFNNAKTDVSDTDKDRLISSLKTLTDGTDITSVVDVEAVMRYFVVHNFLVNSDSYTGMMIHNYYLYEEDGKLSMIPWDYNLAYGTMNSGNATDTINTPINSPVSGGTGTDRPMISWIFANEEYQALYEEYFNEFIAEYFESGYFEELVTDTIALISPYVEKDPTKFCTYEDFLTGAETIKEFCTLRAESIRGQLDGTIGSTSSEQSDESGFVNADHINLSSMGTMGGGMGGFGGSQSRPSRDYGSDKSETPDTPTEAEGTAFASAEIQLLTSQPSQQGGFDISQFAGRMPEGFDPSQMGGNFDPSQFGNGNFEIPEGFEGQMPEDFDPSQFGNGTFDPSQMWGQQGSASSGTNEDSSSGGSANRPQSGFSGQMPSGQGGTQRPNSNGGISPNGNSFGGTATPTNEGNFFLLAASFAVLAVGIIIAFLYKRR